MTAPLPPDRPQPQDAPPAPNPWAVPTGSAGRAAEPQPFPYPYPYPAGPLPAGGRSGPQNGQGTAALVLGLIGAVLGLALVLAWLAWLPALLAVVFGGVGLSLARQGLATNRRAALAGLSLGLAGLLLSLGGGLWTVAEARSAERARAAARERAVQEDRARDAERQRVRDEARRAADAAEQERLADERARRLPFGGSYTYPDGLKVTMAPPTPFEPDGRVFAPPKNSTFVQVRITVVNTGSAPISLHGSGGFARDAAGTLLHPMVGEGEYEPLADALAPGATSTSLDSYALPNAAADRLKVDFSHTTPGERRTVIWTGSPR
ncbi:hypothetical protein [Streptomyces sp. TLI_171]|uniref:hypothetical protein n=1 Tax=Streptomyces sp. TLI_171 TaxID=1938859 RepID=UPI000C1940A9|nr:hypothetical protein [Streptomyces sp. TLI_171]RKE17755.1 hypothetical protein BX266_1021 [Streptomyces sp. TLI_171]